MASIAILSVGILLGFGIIDVRALLWSRVCVRRDDARTLAGGNLEKRRSKKR